MSVCAGKILCRVNVQTGTGVYRDTYRARITDGYGGTVGQKKSVGTLKKKQTDRDDVCRAGTGTVQSQTDSP